MRLSSRPQLYRIGIKFPLATLALCLLLTILAFNAAKDLHIQNDLMSLLPEDMESVRGLEELKENFGGLAYLFVTVETDDPKSAERFADRFAAAIDRHPSVQYVDFRRPVDYFKERQWLYLSIDDLEEIERRVERTAQLEAKGVSPVFNGLMDFADESDRPDLRFQDIREKYQQKFGFETQERVSANNGQFLLMRVKLKENPQNFAATKRFVSEISQLENDIRLSGFSGISVGYTGTYQKTIEQTELIGREMALVSIIVFLALIAILVIYFKGVMPAMLVGLPVVVGIIWTGGLVSLLLGHLNIITSFAAAILAGLGSDYGIYLLTRFYEEREKGSDFLASCKMTFRDTGKATYLSMITTVAAFVALLFSDFRLFVEFGVVGALGLILNYVAMMLLLPAGLSLINRWQQRQHNQAHIEPRKLFHRRRRSLLRERIPNLFAPKTVYGAGVVALFCVVASLSIPAQSEIHFDDGQVESRKLPSYQLSDRIGELFPVHLNPTVLMVNGADEEKETVRKLESLIQNDDKNRLVFNNALGLSSFVPTDQNDKKQILTRIRDKVANLNSLFMNKKEQLLASLEDSIHASSITPADLPVELRRVFASNQANDVYAVYLYPSFGRNDSESMKRYHDGVTRLKKDADLQFTAADGTFVANDIVQRIDTEAARGMVLLLTFLAGILLLVVRPFKQALLIFVNLVGSLVLLSGALWLCRIQLNIINIAVIPIIVGTGIDCFVHLSQRFQENGNLSETLRTKIPAIFIANLTSIVGFGGLLLTSNAGLRSAGWVAVLGIMIVTFFCIYVYPRCLSFEWLKRRSTVLEVESEAADF